MKTTNLIFTTLLTLSILLAPILQYAAVRNIIVSCCNTKQKSDKKDCYQDKKDSKKKAVAMVSVKALDVQHQFRL